LRQSFVCSCIYETIAQHGTVSSAGATPLYNTLRGVSSDYDIRKLAALQVTETSAFALIEKRIHHVAQRVTGKEVVAAAKKYLLPLVSPADSYLSVVCSEIQADACLSSLSDAGWPVCLVSENDVFGPMEDTDSEDDTCVQLVASAMQLIDPDIRSSSAIQNAQRQVRQRLE
jgi:hypothetical protein